MTALVEAQLERERKPGKRGRVRGAVQASEGERVPGAVLRVESDRGPGADAPLESVVPDGAGPSRVLDLGDGAGVSLAVPRGHGAVRTRESEGSDGAECERESVVLRGAVVPIVGDVTPGTEAGRADATLVSTTGTGPSRFIDPITEALAEAVSTWEDIQQTRKAAVQRGNVTLVEGTGQAAGLLSIEARAGEAVKRLLRQHVLWPWLSQHRGLGGVHTARLIAGIGDPRRFPGQACTIGHIAVPVYAIGASCPRADREGEPCPGVMLPPRTTTGVRSVWHYCGLHAVDGRSPRKQKGQKATWAPKVRASILQPDGIADQIVRSRPEAYRAVYDQTKARLIVERGAEVHDENDVGHGPACARGSDEHVGAVLAAESVVLDGSDSQHERDRRVGAGEGGAGQSPVSESSAGLRPFQLDAIARKVAAKAFVGDLLVEWKRAVTPPVSVGDSGAPSASAVLGFEGDPPRGAPAVLPFASVAGNGRSDD